MEILLAFLLQVAPDLKESDPVALPAEGPWQITSSSTGKFIALARRKGALVLDAATGKTVKEIADPVTGLGFDEADGTLTVGGEKLIRFETRAWTETFRAGLEDVEFLMRDPGGAEPRLGESRVSKDGTVHFRTRGGGLSKARVRDGVIAIEKVALNFRGNQEAHVRRILGESGGSLLLESVFEGGRMGAVSVGEKAYILAQSGNPIAAFTAGAEVVLVCERGSPIYLPRSWKCRDIRPGAGHTAAAYDAKRGLVWVAREGTLEAWHPMRPDVRLALPEIKGRFTALDVSPDGSLLHAVEAQTLRRWKFRD